MWRKNDSAVKDEREEREERETSAEKMRRGNPQLQPSYLESIASLGEEAYQYQTV